MDIDALKDLILVLNNALIGEITEEMRCVSVGYSGNNICLYFILYSDNDEVREIISCIETEVIANYYPKYTVSTEINIAPKEEVFAVEGQTVFKRREF